MSLIGERAVDIVQTAAIAIASGMRVFYDGGYPVRLLTHVANLGCGRLSLRGKNSGCSWADAPIGTQLSRPILPLIPSEAASWSG